MKKLPHKSGVYFFKNAQNAIIYIGKARDLAKRVSSYYTKEAHNDWKIAALIQEHREVDYIITENETEALLLEASLIKEHRPKYNVLLKEGQPFLYITFTDDTTPRMLLERQKRGGTPTFGPFFHKQSTRNLFRFIEQTFRLTLCNKRLDHGCLDYHLGKCAGSCLALFDKEGYRFRLQLAQKTLESDFEGFIDALKTQMLHCSKQRDFEQALSLQKYLDDAHHIFETLQLKFDSTKYDEHVRTIQKTSVDYEAVEKRLKEIAETDQAIKLVDCFDISHFQSHSLVGSCVRFVEGKPYTAKFRRFRIKTLALQNDYAALQEIVTRRYKKQNDLPDLILIDGGKGQLSAVTDVAPNVPCIALAKREETVYTSGRNAVGIRLDVHTAVGRFLMAVRDAAHRFALNYHKKRRMDTLKKEFDNA